MSAFEEPILSRINRLDNICAVELSVCANLGYDQLKQVMDQLELRQLEDLRGDHHSPKSSYASTTSSGALTSDGRPSFATDISPENLEKHCRPVSEVLMEVEQKGTLIERILHAEARILKLCLQLEEEFKSERSKESSDKDSNSHSPKKRLKQFVKSCVHPLKSKHKTQLAN